MAAFLQKPVTFTAAKKFLDDKVDLPTALGSLDISNQIPARIRAQSFFSAKVPSANILQGLRKEVEAVARGDYNYAEGRLRLKQFLSKQGYGIPEPDAKEDSDVKTLASTRRLDLILSLNVAMAHAVGQREIAEHPAVMELLPCYEYVAVMDERTRDEHAELNGLVLPKTDPFWRSHFPPWDFNCRCMALDTDAAPNAKSGGFGQGGGANGTVDFNGPKNILPNESGFEFPSAPGEVFTKPDFSVIEDPDLRAQIEERFSAKAAGLGLEQYQQKKAADAAAAAKAAAEQAAVEELQRKLTADPGIGGAEAFGSTLKETGDAVGGSTGAIMVADATGQKWVFKAYHGNATQAQNEFIANRLYALAGVAVPEARLARFNGQLGIASKFIAGLKPMGSARVDRVAQAPALKRGFAADAWLANWDVAGLEFDNVLTRPGSKSEMYRVDQGGALLYRAQGLPKGAAFGSAVHELKTLRDETNPQAARLFAGVSDADIVKQIAALRRKVRPEDIDRIVAQSGLDGPAAVELAATLKARLDYLRDWEPAATPATEAVPAKSADVAGLSEETVRAIAAARLNGVTIPSDGRAIEDHNVKFWHELDTAGVKVTRAIMKLRGDVAEKLTSELKATGGAGPVWQDSDLAQKMITAVKGIATRTASKTALEAKDITRVGEVLSAHKAARAELEKAIAAGHYEKPALAQFDAHYAPWLAALQTAAATGAGQVATWSAPDGKLFAGFPEPARVAAPAAERRWTSGTEIRAKDIDRGFAKETNRVIFSSARWYETTVDGVGVRYFPDTNEVPFALRNTLQLTTGGQDLDAIKKAYGVLDKLGVDASLSSRLDREELYLHQVAYHRKADYAEFKKKTEKLKDQDKRVEAMRGWLSEKIGRDITTLPDYNPDGRYQAFGQGNRYLYRPDLAGKEWDDFKGQHLLHHGVAHGTVEETVRNVLNTGGQFAPSADKLRRGIELGGMSPEEDLRTGGASYFFTRLQKTSRALHGHGFAWKADHLARLDSISYDGDKYGRTSDGEAAIQKRRHTGVEEWKTCVENSGNETIFKNGLSLFDGLEAVVCATREERQNILKIFREHGYTAWPDGRKLEDVVRMKL